MRTYWLIRAPTNQLLFEGIPLHQVCSLPPLSAIHTMSICKKIIKSLQEVFFTLSLGYHYVGKQLLCGILLVASSS